MARKSRKNALTEAPKKASVFIRTAVYLRLSVEDNNNRGNSLENQQLIIQDYLADKPEFKVVCTFTDNGLSGLNYNRPGFQNMLEEIEAGRIDCVIVKDLSRLGRNFIDTGYYIEQYFVTRNTRFIAVTDQFDSSRADQLHGGIMLPLKNMINEAYALDIGRKIKAQAHQAMLDGEFVGARAPYGYMKDPKNCHKLIVDEGAAPVVRQIFQWAYEKMGVNQIVLRLNEAGVVTPNIYKREHGDEGKRYKTGCEKWQTRTVAMILRNQTYTGDLVQGKSKTVDHQQMPASPEDYIIVRNTHPALVSREMFAAVQAYRQQVAGKYTDKAPIPYTPNIFQGRIFCGHCGKSLHR
ncbi:MAG: recombinase family protein, partial [Acidaminococcaceae bacterium]|nr:recombinase family protein [Acidaminococcaceae bacterium]